MTPDELVRKALVAGWTGGVAAVNGPYSGETPRNRPPFPYCVFSNVATLGDTTFQTEFWDHDINFDVFHRTDELSSAAGRLVFEHINRVAFVLSLDAGNYLGHRAGRLSARKADDDPGVWLTNVTFRMQTSLAVV